MPYDVQQLYAKYKTNKCGCGEPSCDECSCEDEKCSCCPVGTVAVYNSSGDHAGCLTPNDAELFIINTLKCEDGFVKLFSVAGVFLGCVTVADALTYQAANP